MLKIFAVFVRPLKTIYNWKCFHICGRLEASSLAYRDCNLPWIVKELCSGNTSRDAATRITFFLNLALSDRVYPYREQGWRCGDCTIWPGFDSGLVAICGLHLLSFFTLLGEVFLRFSALAKNQHFQIAVRSDAGPPWKPPRWKIVLAYRYTTQVEKWRKIVFRSTLDVRRWIYWHNHLRASQLVRAKSTCVVYTDCYYSIRKWSIIPFVIRTCMRVGAK